MIADRKISHEFVEYIPKEKSEGVIYISITHGTAVHSCFCGCGLKVVTPLSPVGWQLIYDGETVSLYPSVGNWNFPCRSHYWVTRDRIVSAPNMRPHEIERNRGRDRAAREAHFRKESGISGPNDVIERFFRSLRDEQG